MPMTAAIRSISARDKVQERYSLAATGPAVARIFRDLLDASPA